MNIQDIQMLKDCVMFTIDNDADLDEQDVKNLWAINMRLNQQNFTLVRDLILDQTEVMMLVISMLKHL